MKPVKAISIDCRLTEGHYYLRVKIVDGPALMLDRVVSVAFTADQLDKLKQGAYEAWLEEEAAARNRQCFPDDEPEQE